MNGRFECLVCQVQNSRVTFAIGEWLGTRPPSDVSAMEPRETGLATAKEPA